MSMTELAKANGIRVVLASITPVCDCTTVQTDRRPQAKIADWNDWLKSVCAAQRSDLSRLLLGARERTQLSNGADRQTDCCRTLRDMRSWRRWRSRRSPRR